MDPILRKANADLATLQQTVTDWSVGRVTDEGAGYAIATFTSDLMALDHIAAPESKRAAASTLEEAANDYYVATNALLSWMQTASRSWLDRFNKSAGDGNLHWDEAIVAIYKGSRVKQPRLVHVVTSG